MSKLVEEYKGYLIKQTKRKYIVVSSIDSAKHSHVKTLNPNKDVTEQVFQAS